MGHCTVKGDGVTYKAKTLSGAQARVRTLERRITHLVGLIDKLDKERRALAKLAAKEPMFFNPLDVWEAEKVRDRILNMEPKRWTLKN